MLCRRDVAKEKELEILALSSKDNQLEVLARVAADASASQNASNTATTIDLSGDPKPKMVAPKAGTRQTTLPVLNKASQKAHKAVARFIIQTGQPWSLVSDPSFIQLLRDCAGVPEAYLPPSEYQVKGRYLDDMYEETQVEVDELLKIIETSGCSIISDGWSDINGSLLSTTFNFSTKCYLDAGTPLINILIQIPQGVVFFKAIDTTGEVCMCHCATLHLKTVVPCRQAQDRKVHCQGPFRCHP